MRDKQKITDRVVVKEDTFYDRIYIFFFAFLPLIYSDSIIDPVLLPRQLFLTLFLVVVLGKMYFQKDNTFSSLGSLHKRTVFVSILGFAFVTLIAALSAFSKSEAVYVTSKYFIEIVYLLVTFYLLVSKKITIYTLQKSVLFFVTWIVLITFFQMLSLHELGEKLVHNTKITATSANKNLVSSILYICLPFLITFLWVKTKTKVLKFISIFNLISILFILYVLQTKTVLISVIVFVFCFLILMFLVKLVIKFKSSFPKIHVTIASIVGVLFLVLSLYLMESDLLKKYVARDTMEEVKLNNGEEDPFTASFAGQQVSDSTSRELVKKSLHTFDLRLSLWNNTIQMYKEHPLFGVGPGNWQIFYPKYGLNTINDKATRDGFTTYQRPHNDWLWIAAELGIFGLIFYLLIVVFSVIYLVKNSFKSSDVEEVRNNLLFASAIVGFMCIYLADFPLERIEHQVLFFTILAYALFVKEKGFSGDPMVNIRYKLPVLLILIVVCILSLVVAMSRLTGEKHTRELKIAHIQSDWNTMISEATIANSLFYRLDPFSIPVEWYKGVALFSLNDFPNASISFQKAYKQHPYNIHIINDLASCYEKLKQHQKAIVYYRKALKISAGFDEARLNLCAVYFNTKRYKSAFLELKKCDPTSQNPKYNLFLPSITKQYLQLDNIPDTALVRIFQDYK